MAHWEVEDDLFQLKCPKHAASSITSSDPKNVLSIQSTKTNAEFLHFEMEKVIRARVASSLQIPTNVHSEELLLEKPDPSAETEIDSKSDDFSFSTTEPLSSSPLHQRISNLLLNLLLSQHLL
jgi:hypothetical protein